MKEKEMRKLIFEATKGMRKRKEMEIKRIETGGTSVGIPDLFLWGKDLTAWIELKQIEINDGNKEIKIPFGPRQLEFARDAYFFGDLCFLLVEIRLLEHPTWYILQGKRIKRTYESLYDIFHKSAYVLAPTKENIRRVFKSLNDGRQRRVI